ncbi:MAG: CPBP family intramembrane metalloprotease [Vicingaceae bacterium]|nr:CPBP family intramembrane metalloprotease [Vicingaceae bacterium]
MLSRTELANKPFLQLILILCLCLGSTIIFSIVGAVIALVTYGFDLQTMQDYTNPQTIEALKLMQLLSAIGLFIVPPILYAIISSKQRAKTLSLNIVGKPINYLLVLVLMFISTPALSWIIDINASMVLPEFMSGIEEWMRTSEAQAQQLTQAFLTFDGFGSLIYILILVAVVPAVGEELLFRGVLQKIFIQWTKNPHWGIWITAFLFSALHMQFFGFIPRMLLGAVFGYVFLWSKSLWLPILGHFINNGSVVLLSYFAPDLMEDTDISFFSGSEYEMLYYVGSLILTATLIFLIRKVNSEKKTNKQEVLS